MRRSRLRPFRLSLLGGALALLSPACADQGLLGPDEILGEYAAVSADGRALPAYVNHDRSQTGGRRLAGATLRLTAPGTMEVALELETVGSDGSIVSQVADTLVVDYALDGTVLTLAAGDDTALFELADRGLVLEDGSLLVIVRFPYPPVTGYDGTYPVDLVFAR
ncbi:MAG: hypothetical protein PVF27_09680 [Gemmatimonadales bacterium]